MANFSLFSQTKYLLEKPIKNPFFGTYFLVWLIRNWELIYSLIYFDKTQKLDSRIEYVKDYFVENSFIHGVLWNILITILVMISTYVILNFTRVIVNFSEKRVKVELYKLVMRGRKFYTKEEYDDIKRHRDEMLSELDTIKNTISNMLEERNKAVEKFKTSDKSMKALHIERGELQRKVNDSEKRVDNLINDRQGLNEGINKLAEVLNEDIMPYLKEIIHDNLYDKLEKILDLDKKDELTHRHIDELEIDSLRKYLDIPKLPKEETKISVNLKGHLIHSCIEKYGNKSQGRRYAIKNGLNKFLEAYTSDVPV
ncbi:MAG: hypothetical protein AB8B65_16865 [Kordia sp.]|uniref:hypothetical protein n=1 Tax=Kordia sp. TaxID=1965332 RepID=UPI0038594366